MMPGLFLKESDHIVRSPDQDVPGFRNIGIDSSGRSSLKNDIQSGDIILDSCNGHITNDVTCDPLPVFVADSAAVPYGIKVFGNVPHGIQKRLFIRKSIFGHLLLTALLRFFQRPELKVPVPFEFKSDKTVGRIH